MKSAGQRFRSAVNENRPLRVVGTINAYCAMMAEQIGHQAIYLSGGALSAANGPVGGAVFTFTLPAMPGPEPGAQPDEAP